MNEREDGIAKSWAHRQSYSSCKRVKLSGNRNPRPNLGHISGSSSLPHSRLGVGCAWANSQTRWPLGSSSNRYAITRAIPRDMLVRAHCMTMRIDELLSAGSVPKACTRALRRDEEARRKVHAGVRRAGERRPRRDDPEDRAGVRGGRPRVPRVCAVLCLCSVLGRVCRARRTGHGKARAGPQ